MRSPDQSGILRTLTKWSGLALRPEEIPGLVHRAFAELRSGRPRPVGLEIPPDVLAASADMEIPGRPGMLRQFLTKGCWSGPARCWAAPAAR